MAFKSVVRQAVNLHLIAQIFAQADRQTAVQLPAAIHRWIARSLIPNGLDTRWPRGSLTEESAPSSPVGPLRVHFRREEMGVVSFRN